mmetsp:Transcript_4740/g.7337  ORF Transcript_4740/g.7337 Transcript_4740/m.7337 type:complete len:193 (-) Transcript_4740:2500-3078(-)
MKEVAFQICLPTSPLRTRRRNHHQISPWKHQVLQDVAPSPLSADATMDILSTEDLVTGTILALSLALLGSYLQGRGNQNDIVLWKDAETEESDMNSEDKIDFGEEAWKDVSRPENYILYTTKVRDQLSGKTRTTSPVYQSEKNYVVFALLLLFVPIFTFEFFLALSRQLICAGDFVSQNAWAENLCSPHFEP